VPEVLEDATIFALDMGALLAGTATAAISKSASSR
jgi:ATP-dependent Clp protease ATP-binding subunit ClpA